MLPQADAQINEPAIYHVGRNQKYKTIKTAYDQWVLDLKSELAIIYIFPGTYREFIVGALEIISLFGVMENGSRFESANPALISLRTMLRRPRRYRTDF